MAKGPRQKLKLLLLAQLLLEQSDEEHPLSTGTLIANLERQGVCAERKSIYSDMEYLALAGLDVQLRRDGPHRGWFIGARSFQLPELKLLVDAVQSSRFLTQRKSGGLIRKLERLASTHQAQELQRQVYVSGRVKTMNESIYYHVDQLHTAIHSRQSITFRYFDYDFRRRKVYRHNGKTYRVRPYGLIWNSENYYLVALDEDSGQIRHYRVDKMSAITLTGETFPLRKEDFDLASYGQKHFGMYHGSELTVTLRAENRMSGVIFDRFGMDIIAVPDGPDHFTIKLPLVMSPQFFGWLFGLEGGVQLIAPPEAVQAYQARLAAAAAQYP